MTARIARVIDYETTGTPEDDGAEIIEFGYTDVDVDHSLLGSDWRSFARPRGPIPPITKAVHHITEADVADAPDARDLFDRLAAGQPDEPAYFVAHNAKFEAHFTPDMGIPWICTYKVARVVWPDAPGHSNQVLRYWLNLPVDPIRAEPAHRALPDTYVTAHLFLRLLAEKTPDEMILISKYPALLKVMNFGKHRGTTFEAAPIDYLEWIRDKSDMDEDTKFSARYWLKKRL
jgi:exodeoxyribonuclease X